jgi:putative spermidine/putrescine transport system ATP-binding protein
VCRVQPLECRLRGDQGWTLTWTDAPVAGTGGGLRPRSSAGSGGVTNAGPDASIVEFDRVLREFGAVRAVDGVSFAIARGGFFALLGPSGSGKTTALRLIAGFERPDAGRILLHGRDVAATPPYERDVNTVFQDYALFPHLSVLDNVTYGLRMRGVASAEARARALARLDMVQLAALAGRKPSQLSGGQRQRVALARALANEPSVLLLDEPLGALDLKLREEMQTELKTLQRRLGITFVFVTHDQGEALSMADHVAVFNAGRIEQIDTPRNLYHSPASEFVARFVGSANVLKGALAERLIGRPGCFALRAEHIAIGTAVTARGRCSGTVVDVLYRGAASRVRVVLADDAVLHAEVNSAAPGAALPAIGATVALNWEDSAPVAVREST